MSHFAASKGRLTTLVLCAAMVCGCGGRHASSVPGPDAAKAAAPFRFREVATEMGINWSHGNEGKSPLTILETGGIGGGFVDIDGDEWLDIVVVSPKGAAVFRNRKERFERLRDSAGLPQAGNWQGLAAGDVDNDGDSDVFLNGYRDQRLFLNEGGRFVDRTAAFGILEKRYWGTSAAFVDFDKDGYLDLFVCRYLNFGPQSRQFCKDGVHETSCQPAIYPSEKGVLYRNAGGKKLTLFAPETFNASSGKNWSVLPFDFDDDGWTDLFISNDTEPADLWRNLKGRAFENVAFQSGVALSPQGRAYGGMGLDSADVDGDGKLDFLLASFTDEPKSLFRNLGGDTFQDISEDFGMGALRPWVTFGCSFGDFDNDGWPDLATLSGHIIDNYQSVERTAAYRQPAVFFHNEEGKHLLSVDPSMGERVTTPMVGRGLARGDYDNDGRVDLLAFDLEGPIRLLHNETAPSGGWLGIKLQGTKSNRDGIGARVRLSVGGREQVTECQTGGSLLTARDPRMVFGLGAQSPESLTVRWPSGVVVTRRRPATGGYLKIVEPD